MPWTVRSPSACSCARRSGVGASIERQLHLPRLHGAAANDDVERPADAGRGRVDQRQTDLGAQGWRVGAAGDDSHLSTIHLNGIAVAGGPGALRELKPDGAARWAGCFHRGDALAADEWSLVELDGPAEAGFEWADVVRELVAVEGH